jgi:hypothetical protein
LASAPPPPKEGPAAKKRKPRQEEDHPDVVAAVKKAAQTDEVPSSWTSAQVSPTSPSSSISTCHATATAVAGADDKAFPVTTPSSWSWEELLGDGLPLHPEYIQTKVNLSN